MVTKKPLLTISLLISNRPDTIPRCLDSLKVIMDEIPSELILIDTSKNEEIHNLLLKYTDKVYEFEWCHDFAKARNEGVRRASGKWFLFLDDDEWLVEAEDIMNFFQTGEYKNYGSANIQIRNFTNPEYTKYADSWVTRLFYLNGDARFEGKVHEYICNSYGQQIFLPAMIHHSGYVFDTEEKRRKHFERNTKILIDLIEEEPDELRWQSQMVQEYHTIDAWEEIANFCQERVKKVKKIENFMDRNHFCTLYAGLIEALMNLERHEEFFAVCEQASKDERSTELLKALILLRKAEHYVTLEDWNAAKKTVEMYLECYNNFKQNEVSMREQLGSLLVHRTFEKNYVDTAYNILIFSELKRGNAQELQIGEEGLSLGVSDGNFNKKFIGFLVELMGTTEYISVYGRLVANAAQDEALCNMICAEAQKWEEKDEKAFLKIAHIYAKVESNFWYMRYCRVVDADASNDNAAVKKAIEELLCVMTNIFYLPDKVYDIIDKYDIKVALLWDEIAADNWQAQMKHFVHSCSVECIERVKSFLQKDYQSDDWHVESLELAVIEKQIIIGPDIQFLSYYNLLKDYAQRKLILYNTYCSEKGCQEEFPSEVQAAIKITEYVELETQDKMQALNRLKEAVDVCPAFAKGIGRFFHFYSELERQRDKKQKQEMKELRSQVMEQVYTMLAHGQNQAALQIAGQLKQMFPEDLEVVELALKVRLKTLE